jgi:uncharacterized protein YjbI with pentapeptide repeats
MTRDETIALLLECEEKRVEARAAALAENKSEDEARSAAREAAKVHWNAWARRLLAERRAIEADGHWDVEKIQGGELKPKNDATRVWMQKASVIFSSCYFLVKEVEKTENSHEEECNRNEDRGLHVEEIRIGAAPINFEGFIFPDTVQFEGAIFSSYVRFNSATFSGRVFFYNTQFFETARFDNATFSTGTSFERATFFKDARFNSTTFIGASSFYSATFTEDALFIRAKFSNHTWFNSTTFIGCARFSDAIFSGGTSFKNATFRDAASYSKAKFLRDANFKGIKVERSLDLTAASFAEVPAFNQADFKQAPDLDYVKFPLPAFWIGSDETELPPKYRAIRRMAIQGADYEREQMAFKGELRSRRGTTDKWWLLGTWLGMFYDGVADCGRSFVRPLLIWFASVLTFAILYLRTTVDYGSEGWSRCIAEDGVPILKALYLSGRNALVLFSGARDVRISQAYKCLFGGTDAQPRIPDSISFLESFVQIPLSATLIFLFLLAVKNRFRVK